MRIKEFQAGVGTLSIEVDKKKNGYGKKNKRFG